MPKFMDLVLSNLRKDRPLVPESLGYTIRIDQKVSNVLRESKHVTIYFRTNGCRFSRFACTMCDYWISNDVSAHQMITAVQSALEKIDFIPDEILINVSGSFYDEHEVPQEARKGILRLLSQLNGTRLIFESHSHDITEEKLDETRGILGDRVISVEMGLESADPWVLRHCINKVLDIRRFVKAVKMLHDCNINSVANIIVGTPFLSQNETIIDPATSTNWAFNNGVNKCVLFPINTKPWTLVYWLEQRGLYNHPPLWALVDVLAQLDPNVLSRVGIAWHRTRPQLHPKYNVENKGPTTCPSCYDKVLNLFDEYIISTNRREIVRQLLDVKCTCKSNWYNKVENSSTTSLAERVKTQYEIIGKEILGESWWSVNCQKVLDVIEDHNLLARAE